MGVRLDSCQADTLRPPCDGYEFAVTLQPVDVETQDYDNILKQELDARNRNYDVYYSSWGNFGLTEKYEERFLFIPQHAKLSWFASPDAYMFFTLIGLAWFSRSGLIAVLRSQF